MIRLGALRTIANDPISCNLRSKSMIHATPPPRGKINVATATSRAVSWRRVGKVTSDLEL